MHAYRKPPSHTQACHAAKGNQNTAGERRRGGFILTSTPCSGAACDSQALPAKRCASALFPQPINKGKLMRACCTTWPRYPLPLLAFLHQHTDFLGDFGGRSIHASHARASPSIFAVVRAQSLCKLGWEQAAHGYLAASSHVHTHTSTPNEGTNTPTPYKFPA